MMNTDHQKPMFQTQAEADEELNREGSSHAYGSTSCWSCFFPCGGTCSSEGYWSLLESEGKERWWVTKAKSLKEWSEVVAGPKWKTFLRRFRCGNGRRKAPGGATYCYNPESYALNFDGGGDIDEEGERSSYFSSRFACPTSKGTAPS